MVNIMKLDGSFGEGGGQILRTAVALSAITGEPVDVYNIRSSRSKPGLAPQHVKAVESVASICDAEVYGCSLGSNNVVFNPGKIKSGSYEIDIGTAGSITLLLQCMMLVAIRTPGKIELGIRGGTDVSWSPSLDYLRFVTLNALSSMGYKCDIKLVRRGYYPRGGGYVQVIINPSTLEKTNFDQNNCEIIEGISHSSGLPSHIAKRQADSAERIIRDEGYNIRLLVEVNDYPSTGSGITLWCGRTGGSFLGRQGIRAEKVGSSAAEFLLTELKAGAGMDIYLADQIIPYMALAGGGSLTTRMLSPHTKTNIWVTEQFLDVKFRIENLSNGLFRVSI